MATPSNSFLTYDAKGNREDLSNVIYNIDPTDTPFISAVGREAASAVLHEWQTDALAAASTANAVLEGDDATTDAVTATTRLSNTCQISDKVSRVTGTQQAVVSAGRKDELAYQVAKDGKELKRDIESIILTKQAEATGDTTNARKLGALGSWINTNAAGGTSFTAGSLGNTAQTDGTQRPITEALLKARIKAVWDAGGDPDCIMVGSFNKQKISEFTGNATRMKTAEDKTLIASIDIYDSDFGELEIVPNRFQRARDCWIVQKDMAAVAYLRPFRLYDLAKTGDSERKQLLAEYTLVVRNEKAHGYLADLTTS